MPCDRARAGVPPTARVGTGRARATTSGNGGPAASCGRHGEPVARLDRIVTTPDTPLPTVPPLPRRILVAVDGSEPSLRAVAHAVALARAAGGSVQVLHAISPLGLRGLGSVLPPGALGEAIRQCEAMLRTDAETTLAPARRLCEAAGVTHTVVIEIEEPRDSIRNAAAGADLVVMGTRGLGALAGLALGSLSHRVPSLTSVPVLLVP